MDGLSRVADLTGSARYRHQLEESVKCPVEERQDSHAEESCGDRSGLRSRAAPETLVMALRPHTVAAALLLLVCPLRRIVAQADVNLTLNEDATVAPIPLNTLLIAIQQSPRLQDAEDALSVRAIQPPRGLRDPIELASAFEGDIVIHPSDFTALNEDNAAVQPRKLWKGGVINYALSPSFSSRERAVIASAFTEIERQTCLRMRPIRPGATGGDYVFVVKKTGCFSSVGRSGGMQELSLGDGCVFKGIAMHEFMHAAGFWHEQSRPDRDDHVTIHYDNIQAMMEFNFQKYTWGEVQSLGEPYDIGSVMHYGPYAFARDRSRPTISDRRNTGVTMGQRQGFSSVDVRKLRKLYKCDGTTPPPPPPPKPTGDCTDKSPYCTWWARRGECKKNMPYMHRDCRKACKVCTTDEDCVDLNSKCRGWSERKECRKNPLYMLEYCKKSCNVCKSTTVCKDDNTSCKFWANSGECRKNPDYMLLSCKKSCGRC
ncbi:zinc metalloproteinase nas-15-like [Pollicipes pollicipes]|uniref:zinc metalloproteinase nas-15-like n=1 Tax=Pollicipes pollicipes TaxID=41117 RepID=UPI001884F718|nr:zinc metalloproteinase nas-15-like [Pollicipes pollicipes]